MRDLGEMGESTFSLWCAQAGLASNGSKIDKHGWDFFVEFPSEPSIDVEILHQPAIECKVQVKATDKTKRKLAIKLSNLRRLITASMPAFFVFIEFDGGDSAAKAFLVHVNKDLITKTLERIHQLGSEGEIDLHKRSMTIQYGPENEIGSMTGSALKAAIEGHVPRGMMNYVSEKNEHLRTTGFEDGFAQMRITTSGEENLIDLIDVSIGLKKSVQIATFESAFTRFGIKTSDPSSVHSDARLEMPDLKPSDIGKIIFKEDPLLPGLAFPCRYYYSPLNKVVPKKFVKIRIEADCFDLVINPFTGAATYSFNAGAGVRLQVKELRNVIRLMYMLSSSAKSISLSMMTSTFKNVGFWINAADVPFAYTKLLDALDTAVKICDYFEMSEPVLVSLEEVMRDAPKINSLILVISGNPRTVRCDFSIQGEDWDPSKETACVAVSSIRIGRRIFGIIFVIIGKVTEIGENRYSLAGTLTKVERKFVSLEDGELNRDDVISAVEEIEKIYEAGYQVITTVDKSAA
ncbi:hypothetical protein [Herbaspirillum huttiense]|uniref:hypothetical protein n=1 Tax=Herbaspirillum huttiense TaxID=863372 RepID=UPI0039AF03BF